MSKAVLTTKKLINLSPEMVDEVKEFRFDNRIETESEAIRLLIDRGLNLPMLCIDILDALESEGLLEYGDVAAPAKALDDYLGTRPSGEIPQFEKSTFDDFLSKVSSDDRGPMGALKRIRDSISRDNPVVEFRKSRKMSG